MLILTIGENTIELTNFSNSTIQQYLDKQTRLSGKYIDTNIWEGIMKGEATILPVRIEYKSHQMIK